MKDQVNETPFHTVLEVSQKDENGKLSRTGILEMSCNDFSVLCNEVNNFLQEQAM